MKKTIRIFALLLAMIMTITSFAAIALAEGEETESSGEGSVENSTENSTESSGDDTSDESSDDESSDDESSDDNSSDESSTPEAPKVTANIVINGVPADALDIYFNDQAVSGTYSGDEGAIDIRIEAKDGYEITSAEYKIPGLAAVKLTEANGKYSATTYPLSEGATFTLTVNAKVVPKQVDLDITANGEDVYIVKANGLEVDLTEYGVMTGDVIEITFEGEGEFDSDLAWLSVNGTVTKMSSFTYSFEITDNTKIVFYYRLVPVTVTLRGPAKFVFTNSADDSSETVTNNGAGTKNETIYLIKGAHYRLYVTPADDYIVSGGVVISEPDKAVDDDGVYFFRPSGPTTVSATMRKTGNGTTANDDYTVILSLGMGGQVEVDNRTVLGGTGTNVTVKKGDDLDFVITADDGFVIDIVKVDGKVVKVEDGKYTIKNITNNVSVSISFKSENQGDIADAIGVDDINWKSEPIVVDIRGGKAIKREVLDKIETLSGDGKFVEFKSESGSIFVPYGGRTEGTSEVAMLHVTPLVNGALFDVIKGAINSASGGAAVYKAYTFNMGVMLPEGSAVSFAVGSDFVGGTAMMYLFNASDSSFFAKRNATTALEVAVDGTVGKFAYDNEGILICSKDNLSGTATIEASTLNEGGIINPEGINTVELGSDVTYNILCKEGYVIKQLLVDGQGIEGVAGLTVYNYTFKNASGNHTIKVEFLASENADEDSSNGTLTTVLVIFIIVMVAIAGAAALFVVKWRQEKF